MADPKISAEHVKIKKHTFLIRDMQRFRKNKFLAEIVELLNCFVDINVTFSNKLNEIFTDFVTVVHSCMSKHAPLILASRKKTKINTKAMDNQRNSCFYSSQAKNFIHFTIYMALNCKNVFIKYMLTS